MKTHLRYLALLLALPTIIVSQTLTVKVWPDGVPGSKTDNEYHEETIPRKDGRLAYLKVTDPELWVYLPDSVKANGTAVIICPGGSYRGLAIGHEGEDVARWFNSLGIVGIVLKYRLPSDSIMEEKSIGPLQDVQKSIRIVRRRSREWGIDPHRIGIMGFSAGGHLAATASTMYDECVYELTDTTSARPDFSLLIYGVLSMQRSITHQGSFESLLGKDADSALVEKFSNELHVDKWTPPALLVHAADDHVVPVENSIRFFQALEKHSIPAELHIYEHGGHGFGLAPNGGTESAWPEACARWLRAHGWL